VIPIAKDAIIRFIVAKLAQRRFQHQDFFPFLHQMLADYHLHTPLCLHAEGHPRDYAAQAEALGLAEIGFSDHNPMPEYFDNWRMPISDFPRYLDMVDEARADHPNLPIRLGLECDYLAGHESWIEQQAKMADFDYLIGSVHYVGTGWAVEHGQARGASAHAKNASYARRDRGARVASRKQRNKDARVQAQAHYESEGEEGKRHTARGTAIATSSSVQRRLSRRRTFEEALGAAQRWTPKQLCLRCSNAGGTVTSLRMH
jgi:hypothetical protein